MKPESRCEIAGDGAAAGGIDDGSDSANGFASGGDGGACGGKSVDDGGGTGGAFAGMVKAVPHEGQRPDRPAQSSPALMIFPQPEHVTRNGISIALPLQL
jgi:hypothetical protein